MAVYRPKYGGPQNPARRAAMKSNRVRRCWRGWPAGSAQAARVASDNGNLSGRLSCHLS